MYNTYILMERLGKLKRLYLRALSGRKKKKKRKRKRKKETKGGKNGRVRRKRKRRGRKRVHLLTPLSLHCLEG
jgi:hypothetical protein